VLGDGAAPARPPRSSIARLLISQRLQRLSGRLAALVAVATAVFHPGVPKLGWVNAFYFTVTTFTSTGNGDLAQLARPRR